MIEQPNAQEQTPQQGKLVLPVYPDEEQHKYADQQPPARSVGAWSAPTFAPGSTTSSFSNPLLKLSYFWRQDAAYKVLILAVATIAISGVLFMALSSASLLQGLGFSTQNATASQNPSAEIHPSGTVDLHPTFPTPSGGTGSNTSSQPPPNPSFYPTPDTTVVIPQPTSSGSLTVQITSIPSQVTNRSRVFVGVTTSEGNVEVRLQVYYNASPFIYNSTRMTDDNGNATLPWRVEVSARGFGQVIATVEAVAVDQNGQQAVSQVVQVAVVTSGFGG